jgi:hypothetical protein
MLKTRLLFGVSFGPLYAAPGEGGGGAPPEADDVGTATPDAEGSQPPVEGAPAEEGGEPPAQGVAASAEGDEPPAAPPAETWQDKELRRKHAQLQQERREKADLKASLEAAQEMLNRLNGGDGLPPPESGERPAASAARPAQSSEDEIQAAARQLVAQQNFDNAANDADKTGRERYKDKWDKATGTLATLGGFDPETMQGILATDDPAKVLFTLGDKPEEYQRIMDLPPAKRLAEMVKIGMPEPRTPPKRPSGAAPPTEPVGGRNRGDPNALSDELDDETWYARRQAQKKARFEARRAGA